MSQTTNNFPSASVLDAFQATLRGALILPTADNDDDARRVYNGMIDRRPGAIVRCTGVADILRSVTFARENGLPLAVRGGGHNGGGLGTISVNLSNVVDENSPLMLSLR